MKSSINAMFAYSNQFVSDGVSLQAAIQDAELTCTYHGHGYFTALERSLASYRTTSLELANNISPLVSDIDTVESYQKYFASGAPLYILWILGMIVIFLIIYFSYRESRISLKATLAFSCSIFIVFIFSGTILMSLTMFFGDLCSDPSYNTVMNLPSTHNIQNLGAYYSTCDEALYSTFLITESKSIQNQINFMYNRTLFAISNSNVCPNDPNLQTMNTILINANNTMSLFDHSAKCEPIQSMWYDMMNNGVCEEFYIGVVYAWGGQLLTSFFLFFLLITTSFTYQFYPNLHKSGGFDENGSTTYPSEEEEERERELERATTMSGTVGGGRGGDGSTIVGGDYDEKMDEKVDVEQGVDDHQHPSRPSSIANYYPRNSYNVSRHSNPHPHSPSPASSNKRKKRRSTNNSISHHSNSNSNSKNEGDDNFVFHAQSYEDDDNDEEGGLSPPFHHMSRSTDMLLREDDEEEENQNENSSSSYVNNHSENTNSATDPFTSSTWGFDSSNPSSMPI
jgi:hypothetical protein